MPKLAALLPVLILALASDLYGQSYRRFELSSQTTTLRITGETPSCGGCPVAKWMIGPEFTFNLNQHFALDGALAWSPSSTRSGSDTYGGRLHEVLIGPKASIRGRRFTFFTKARPGFVSWSHALTDVQFINFPPTSLGDIKLTYARRNFFAFAMTGGIEYALSPHLTLTAELGDTLVRPTSPSGYVWPMTHNLQTTMGASYRFGKESVEPAPSNPTHKFFDRFNIALITVSLLSQTADAVTTQRRLKSCWRNHPGEMSWVCSDLEGNPIARPFVNQGWPGQVSLAIIVNSAQTMVMYAIHRMGYHRVERVVPLPLTIEGGIQAYKSLQRY